MRAESAGVIVKLTINDTAMAKAMVRPKLFKNMPTMPLRKAIGTNTASSESVVASTAMPISRGPSIEAVKESSFFSSMWRKMFSTTMIASSMTMPTASARATRLMILSVRPCAHMTPNAAMIEVGMASAEMSVARELPRKTRTTMAANIAPSTRCSFTAWTLVRMTFEVSRTISTL